MRRRLAFLCAVILLPICGLLFSCGSDTVSPGDDTTKLAWFAWRDPNIFSYTYELNAIWGISSRDVYAVGSQGVVIRYDGSEWTVLHCGGEKLNGVWASSPKNVIAVGAAGTVMRFDGHRWTKMPTATSADLLAVWGRARYDVYAVGSDGTVLHCDGSRWTVSASSGGQPIVDVWGDQSRCFAVGPDGMVLQLSSTGCSRIDTGTESDLLGIAGTPATGLCAVGEGGAFLRYDGATWERVRSGTLRTMSRICGTKEGHLVTVCGPRIREFDGKEWTSMDVTPTGYDYYSFADVWGLSMQGLFVLQGDGIQHYDGSTWTSMDLPELPSGDEGGARLLDVWGSSSNDVYAVGSGGAVLHYDGTGWATTTAGESDLVCLFGISKNELYAANNRLVDEPPCFSPPCPENRVFSSIFTSDGEAWIEMSVIEDKWIRGLWGMSGDALFGVGAFAEMWEEGGMGGIRYYRTILRYDGASWIPMIDETTQGTLNDVWGSSENDIFAVGSGGAILHYDGTSWVEMQSGTGEDLLAVWGVSAEDVVAVGGGGVILRFDGVSWTAMSVGSSVALTDVWGSSASDFVAVGGGGSIHHYDGTMWTAISSPAVNALTAVWGAAEDDIFAVGEYGAICHYGSH